MSIVQQAVEELVDQLSEADKKIMRRRQSQKEYYQRNREKKIAQSMANYVYKTKPTFDVPIITKKTEYNEQEILGLIMNDTEYASEQTRKTHVSAIKRLFNIVTSLKQLNKNFKAFINTLENNSDFSTNTIKSTIASLLSVIAKYNIEIINSKNMKSLVNLYNKYILKSNDEQIVINSSIVVPTWHNYLNKCERRFGKNSKQFLIASLYSILSVRDDFASMIFSRMDDAVDPDTNYLAINSKEQYFIILNKYKTSKSYKQIEFELPLKIKRLVKNWLSNNAVLFNQSVFKESSLSPFVTQMHRDLGFGDLNQGSINLFRKMTVSALEGSSYEDKVETANSMAHGILTQQKYKRLLKIDEE